MTDAQLMADVAQTPELSNAFTVCAFSGFITTGRAKLGATESHASMRRKVAKVGKGDLSELEGMLVAQAVALNSVFTEMARRASTNMGEHLAATDIFLRLALKAQAQARATVETIAEIKNPRQVAFVRQANIAHTQQVNNESRARENNNQSNELSGRSHELPQDTRASRLEGAVDPQMETVAAIHGATIVRG